MGMRLGAPSERLTKEEYHESLSLSSILPKKSVIFPQVFSRKNAQQKNRLFRGFSTFFIDIFKADLLS